MIEKKTITEYHCTTCDNIWRSDKEVRSCPSCNDGKLVFWDQNFGSDLFTKKFKNCIIS